MVKKGVKSKRKLLLKHVRLGSEKKLILGIVLSFIVLCFLFFSIWKTVLLGVLIFGVISIICALHERKAVMFDKKTWGLFYKFFYIVAVSSTITLIFAWIWPYVIFTLMPWFHLSLVVLFLTIFPVLFVFFLSIMHYERVLFKYAVHDCKKGAWHSLIKSLVWLVLAVLFISIFTSSLYINKSLEYHVAKDRLLMNYRSDVQKILLPQINVVKDLKNLEKDYIIDVMERRAKFNERDGEKLILVACLEDRCVDWLSAKTFDIIYDTVNLGFIGGFLRSAAEEYEYIQKNKQNGVMFYDGAITLEEHVEKLRLLINGKNPEMPLSFEYELFKVINTDYSYELFELTDFGSLLGENASPIELSIEFALKHSKLWRALHRLQVQTLVFLKHSQQSPLPVFLLFDGLNDDESLESRAIRLRLLSLSLY
ncbi:hypothetical protein HYV79_04995 [Candidatus Woesearchaeota archaeon]|nr:hypothetical protein [Candidatus Woesearchaeota archaeon]